MTETKGTDVFGSITPLEGFHEIERDNLGEFVWSEKRFRIGRPPGEDYWLAELCFHGDDAELTFGDGEGSQSQLRLGKDWNTYPLDFSGYKGDSVTFDLNRVISVDGDSRELGVMFRRFRTVSDRTTLDIISDTLANKLLNDEEFRRGKAVLESTPINLRFANETRCNMTPPCVYCDWDTVKVQEREAGFRQDLELLSNMSRFYEHALIVSEVSFGEPLLKPDLGQVVAMIDDDGKRYEITSNGILLDDEGRRIFLGRNVILSVSIDAGTPQGFARYRSRQFRTIIANLSKLCEEKKQFRNLPLVIVPFIAMSSNLDEMEAFLDVMKEVGVDMIKLRSLHAHAHLMDRVVHRCGVEFHYGSEVLSLERMKQVYDVMAVAAKERGLTLVADIHQELHLGNDEPLCSLPWRTLYVARNGPNTCCYTRVNPLSTWHEMGNASSEEFLQSIWNGEQLREMRADLAERRLPKRCRAATACPVTKRVLSNA